MYYSVNIPKSLMVYITPQPSSEPWRILHNPLLAKVYIVLSLPGDVLRELSCQVLDVEIHPGVPEEDLG